MALITKDQFKSHYPALVGTTQDAKLDLLIDRADRLMAAFCGWPANDQAGYTMVSSTYTLYPDRHYSKTRALDMGLRWMGTITSVHIDADWVYGSDTLVAAADYLTDNRLGLLWLKPASTKAWLENVDRAHKVVLAAGFSTTPDDLVAIAAMAVRHLWDLGFDQGNQSVSFGEVSSTKAQGVQDHILPPAVRNALSASYVNWSSRLG